MVTINETALQERLPELSLQGRQAMYASRSLREWLEETREDREAGRVVPFLLREKGAPVGFFALAPSEKEEGTVLLRNFFVVPQAQGRGIASRALLRLPALVRRRFPAARAVALLVNVTNEAAMRTYLKAGFVDTGVLDPGREAGPAHVYRLVL